MEHIPDDARALQIVNQKLKPGGRIALSVPAYMWLWGAADIVNQTRRYARPNSDEIAAHFSIERITTFNTFLFLPIAIVRLIVRHRSQTYGAEETCPCPQAIKQSAI